ncbi:hypothetical protein [Alicyclobacillus vulcanalis]|uniref:Uncharacterized protein n=1 Tax=Alicyclobacillus vulcanalis TaxID=252246 RepID=A0A1N7LJ53_9BACL|nr:hypothetical protein [Alicyclobacillus vulcanalis]SIS73842.1 hypothetical protein SAMN05421799_103179 [Alicyclobacillus vulcanalis]
MSTARRSTPWAALAGFFAAQWFITFALYFVFGILSVLSILIIGSYSFILSGPVTFALYAAIWGGIWLVSYRKSGMAHFTAKLAAATTPLVAMTAAYVLSHPKPNYRLMIPLLPEEIHFYFAALVTLTLLFPWYAMVWRQTLASPRPAVRFTALMIPSVIAGVLIFAACDVMLPENW